MLRIFSAASGEEVAALEASELESMEHGSTVGSLKRYLAKKCFEGKSRFQLRILREGDPTELREDEDITAPLDLQLILMNHLPPDVQRDDHFLDSCERGDLEEVERSLHALQNPNLDPDIQGVESQPLSVSAQVGQSNLVRLLLEAGADVEARGEDEEEDSYDWTALHHAAAGGHLEVLRVLLEFGADKDATNSEVQSALHLAVVNRHLDVVRLLLESRAEQELMDSCGCRPLHVAADTGDPDIVRLLLASAAELEATKEDGYRPLHYAALSGSATALRLLLDANADKEVMTSKGFRPLHLAAQEGHEEVVRILLDRGAQKTATDALGRTPSKLAAIDGHRALEELLDHHKRQRR